MSTLSTIACYLARKGWAVYPQVPGGNTPLGNCRTCREDCGWREGTCPCLTSAVDPCHALHSASTDVELTRARWAHASRCNPALHLGRSGLVVLDIDCHDDTLPDELAPGLPNPGVRNGICSFTALLDHLGQDWPSDTLAVETPTGGLHLYYRAPQVPLRHCLAAWQVEVKAGACSITAPGSVRTLDDGTTGIYRRISEATEPGPFPAWLGRWLVSLGRIPDPTASRDVPSMPTRAGRTGHTRRWWERAWNDQLHEIATAPAGTRNDVVLRRGLRLFNLARQAGCPWTSDEAEQALINAQYTYAANTGRPASPGEYRAVAQATRARAASTGHGGAA